MRFFIATLTLVFLGGCFQSPPSHWQHKTIPSSQWKSDYQKCQRAAERYLGIDGRYDMQDGASQYEDQMRLFEAGKKQKKLSADCMRKMGYVPIR